MSLRRLLPLLLAGAIGLSGGGHSAARAETGPEGPRDVVVETDIAGAKDLARRAIAAQRFDLAAQIARAILAAAPDDAEAHVLLAAALTRAGQPQDAIAAGKRGYRLARGAEARFEAAWLTAEALANAGRPWAAKLWLRRADLHAPTPEHEAVLARAYAGLSAQGRLAFGVSVFGGPSENVNGGSLHDTFWFMGLPLPIAEALPGVVAGTTVEARYRLAERTSLRLAWSHGEVFLGREARLRSPSARGSDYRKDEVSLGLAHAWQDEGGRFALISGLSVGRRWTGGLHSVDLARASVEARRAVSDSWTLSATLDVEAVDVPARPVADSVTTRFMVSTSHLLPRIGALTFDLGAVTVASEAAGIAWRGPALALSWRPPAAEGKTGVSVALSAEQRDYWRSPGLDPDLALSFSLTADLPQFEVMGFEPVVSLKAARTFSDVVVRDTRDIGLSVGIASRF